jgi:hypothetical protein
LSYLVRIPQLLAKHLTSVRFISITALDILSHPKETLLRYLQDSLPTTGGIVQLVGLGTILDVESDQNEELFSIIGLFIREVFYHGSSYLLVLLDCAPWDATQSLRLDWEVACRDMGPSYEALKRYLESCAQSLSIPTNFLLPLMCDDDNFDLAKVDGLCLTLERDLCKYGPDDLDRRNLAKKCIQRFLHRDEEEGEEGEEEVVYSSLDDTIE